MPEKGTDCNMAELEAAKKTRSAAQGWVTRALTELYGIFKDAEKDRFDIEQTLTALNHRVDQLESAQAKYETLLGSDEEINASIEEIAPVLAKARKGAATGNRLLAKLEDDKESASSVGTIDTAKLPKLELKTFSGEVTEWVAWWQTFVATIDDNDKLADVTKFSYLQSLLSDKAAIAIKGLTLSSGNYATACKILQEKFGRSELIIFKHIEDLLNLQSHGKNSLERLQSLYDQVVSHVRSLEQLEIKGEQYGVILTPLILARLPPEVRMEWAREGERKEGDLDFLLQFLKTEVQRRERAETFKTLQSSHQSGASSNNDQKTQKRPTATALLTPSTNNGRFCGLCKGKVAKTHYTVNCRNLKKMTLEDRLEAIKAARLCFQCLSPNHQKHQCTFDVKCHDCGESHFRILCGKQGQGQNNENSEEVLSQVGVTMKSRGSFKADIFMQVAKVVVEGPSGKVSVNFLFDSGSNCTYITSGLAKKLGLKPIAAIKHRYNVFGGNNSGFCSRNLCEFYMKCADKSQFKLTAIEVPKICAPMNRPQIPTDIITKLPLAWNDTDSGLIDIDVLVGLDFYWSIVLKDVVEIPGHKSLVAQKTLVGYILSGHSMSEQSTTYTLTSHQLLCLNDISDSELRRLWDLDVIGISDVKDRSFEDPALAEFNNSIDFVDGRYSVNLPWKEGMKTQLQSNRRAAEIRLSKLSRKLDMNPSLRGGYNSALSEMETSGVIEEVPSDSEPSGPVFYLPHRPVVKESSVTTKIRPVFDGSAKAENGLSLNDCLESGPSLIPDLVEILIRFRRWLFALSGDISKAFLQVSLKDQDKDVHRFLWQVGKNIRIMRFNRVTFGVKSSPFLLNATIRHHLNKCEQSNVVKELQENLYVDDWLSGSDSTAGVGDMFVEAGQIMAKANMMLAKWSTNSKDIRENLMMDTEGGGSVKVLGALWSCDSDSFSFTGLEIPADLVVTKRVVLSVSARIFDPLGFLLPFTVTAKCLFQKLWLAGLEWDEEIPQELASEFAKWIQDFELVKSWTIPRRYSDIAWSEIRGVELHAFGDASMSAYGAVVYLRIPKGDGSFVCSFVIAKGRVAPLKKVTLPRLELLASLLAARLLTFVRKTLRLPETVQYRCWTDSTASLGWLQGDPNRWKQFIANRVVEIQELTDPLKWSYCPTSENPADLLTRGISAATLISSVWLKGPDWLNLPEDQWPLMSGCKGSMAGVVESEVLQTSGDTLFVKVFPVENYGKFTKAIRVVGWVYRFIHNMKNPSSKVLSEDLSFEEQASAKTALFRQCQEQAYGEEMTQLKKGKCIPKGSALFKLSPYLDGKDLLRVLGRLENSDLSYSEKHPLILPRDHCARLIVRYMHVHLKHAGVSTVVTTLRNTYWIVGVRQLCKRVVKECVQCQRVMSKPCNQVAAPLPEDRVSRAPPFSITGVDYAGPLYCSDYPKDKFYICLYTCAVIRAVHLELTSALSAGQFVLAFRRFSARRGVPNIVYSDNAKTFPGAQKELQAVFGLKTPNWKFIVPRAPWWGGWWERLVQSVKGAIKKSVGTRSMSKMELETLLYEIEFVVNSRPLTLVSDEISTDRPLTPNHFLLGEGVSDVTVEDQESVSLSDYYLRNRDRLNYFWEIWSKDYLRNLPCVVPHFEKNGQLKIGSVVVVREDNVPRLSWVLGRVLELIPGKDGKIRTVKVQTSKGALVRPVQRLHHIECLDTPEGVIDRLEEAEQRSEPPVTPKPFSIPKISDPGPQESGTGQSRFGRKYKPVDRLGL